MESELKNKDFNVREFILQNFLQSDFTINLNKAQKQLSEILELQNKTFDEITTSVDNNLQDYVTISLQLTQLQEQLDSLTFRFNNVEQSVNYSQQQMQQQIYQIDVIVQNLKLVASLETGMKNLRKLINLVDFKIDESNYGIINSTINITKCKKLYSKIDSNPYIRQICHQHDIQGTISLKWQQVQNILEQEYVLSLQNKDGIRCQVLLQSFSIMELNKKADKLTIQFIIKPQLDQAYVKLLANKQALLSDSQPFEDFIQAVQQINKNNLFLSEIHQDLFQFKQMLLELVYIYLSQKECSNIYSIAVPDLFQHNFKLIIDLKQQLNVVFEKGSEIEKKFLDKWNLQTYFLMRQTQIIKQFENQITQSYDQALQDNIQLVLSENVYLPQLKVKFYQFIIQLCNRFSIIVQEILKQPQKDVLPILNQVANLYQQKLTPIDKINELIKQKLHNLIQEIIVIYQKQVVLECVQNLEPFNGIPAKYRMTNKDFPTQSSNFCGNVFRPLQNSIQKLNDQFIQKLFSKSVCNDVMIAFAQIKKQAIDACDKNEELMQKMGVKKNESQDNLKIKNQFQLDEQDLLNQIENKFL